MRYQIQLATFLNQLYIKHRTNIYGILEVLGISSLFEYDYCIEQLFDIIEYKR